MAEGRPNILVFMTDDHGQWASGAYGNTEIQTPVMDWMAETGIRLDHAFCPIPVCSPARASFWTGRIPSAHGIHDWIAEPDRREDLPTIEEQKTLAVFLKEAGYRTGLVGKWHCGSCWRRQAGFDTWFTSALGTRAMAGKQAYFDNETVVEFHGHQHEILTDRVVRFLRDGEREANGERDPFFLFVGYTNTHTPHKGEPEPIVSRYRGSTFPDIPREPFSEVHGHARIEAFDPDEEGRREQLAQYYAAVDVIDRQLARIISELESSGELENTLIVYTSDHGHMNGHHGLHTKGNATIPGNFLEESIHVPLLVRCPGRLPAGRVVEQPVDHCDLFASLLDIAGLDPVTVAAEVNSPGRSCLPLLRGDPVDWRREQICEYANARMIRTPRYKLIRRYPGMKAHWPDAFFDLGEDPRETENRIADSRYRDIMSELDAYMEAHFARFGDPEREGINLEALTWHNAFSPWEVMPGENDHRQ